MHDLCVFNTDKMCREGGSDVDLDVDLDDSRESQSSAGILSKAAVGGGLGPSPRQHHRTL